MNPTLKRLLAEAAVAFALAAIATMALNISFKLTLGLFLAGLVVKEGWPYLSPLQRGWKWAITALAGAVAVIVAVALVTQALNTSLAEAVGGIWDNPSGPNNPGGLEQLIWGNGGKPILLWGMVLVLVAAGLWYTWMKGKRRLVVGILAISFVWIPLKLRAPDTVTQLTVTDQKVASWIERGKAKAGLGPFVVECASGGYVRDQDLPRGTQPRITLKGGSAGCTSPVIPVRGFAGNGPVQFLELYTDGTNSGWLQDFPGANTRSPAGKVTAGYTFRLEGNNTVDLVLFQ